MTEHDFTVKVHFPDGKIDGFRTVKIDGWAGVGIVCPRSLFQKKKKEDVFRKAGVYVLVGRSGEKGKEKIYIGMADPILDRLETHCKEKDFWTKTIFFTSIDDSLTATHAKFLESRLITLARESGQCELDNANTSGEPSQSREEVSRMEKFLREMRKCFGTWIQGVSRRKPTIRKADLSFAPVRWPLSRKRTALIPK